MIFKAWRKIPKKIDREKEEELSREPLEKGDRFAMLTSAFLVLFLPALAVLLLMGGLCLFLLAIF